MMSANSLAGTGRHEVIIIDVLCHLPYLHPHMQELMTEDLDVKLEWLKLGQGQRQLARVYSLILSNANRPLLLYC